VTLSKRVPPPALVAQAKWHPGEWLYEIVGSFGPQDVIPPQAIRGAWKVNDRGEIEGVFKANPKFAEDNADPAGHNCC
jgi:hypothetical protein